MLRIIAALSLLATGHCLVVSTETELTPETYKTVPKAQQATNFRQFMPLWSDETNHLWEYDHWTTVKAYKAKAICASNRQKFHKKENPKGMMNLIQASRQCASMGIQFPTLVSHDPGVLAQYEQHMCGKSHHTVGNGPAIADVLAKVALVENGCFQGSMEGERLAWNTTHIMHLAQKPQVEYMEQKERDELQANFAKRILDAGNEYRTIQGNVIVLPSTMDFAYQKVLMDFIPQAYASFEWAKKHNTKFLVRSKMQLHLLKSLGVPDHHIVTDLGKTQTVCVENGKGYSLHVLKMDSPTPRQVNHRLGTQVASTVLQVAKQKLSKITGNQTLDKSNHAKLKKIESTKPAVVFAKRCKGGSDKREIANENQALETIKEVMNVQVRDEELVSFCSDELSFVETVNVMNRAKVVIGSQGALANLLFAKPSCHTHVIEFVYPPSYQGRSGLEPYSSYYNGGVGSPFAYKLVQMTPGKAEKGHEKMTINVDDFELALNQVWYTDQIAKKEI